jgi:hypothetical protein
MAKRDLVWEPKKPIVSDVYLASDCGRSRQNAGRNCKKTRGHAQPSALSLKVKVPTSYWCKLGVGVVGGVRSGGRGGGGRGGHAEGGLGKTH